MAPPPDSDIISLVTTLILCLWYAAIASKALAAYRLFRDDLVPRFATVFIFLTVCVARSLVLVTLKTNIRGYKLVLAYSTPLMLLLEGFAVVGVFWAVAEQYPRFRKTGSVILVCLTGIGASAAWLTYFVGVPSGWSAPWQIASLLQRNGVLVTTVVLAGTRFLLPRIPGIPIRPSARRMADILTANAALEWLGTAAFIAAGPRYNAIGQVLVVGGNLACMLAIAFFVTRESDQCAAVKPVTERDEQAMIEAERWFEQLLHTASDQTR
jgi:hypothetical protein